MPSARFRLTGPALAILGTLLAGTCAMPFVGSATIDAESVRREELLVRRNIVLWIDEVENSLKPYSISDEAIERIDNAFDADWVKMNLAPSIFAGTQNRLVAVLDGDEKLLAYEVAESNANDSLFRRRSEMILNRARLLVRSARIFERSRPATIAPDKIAESTIIMVDGVAILLTATIIQPDFRDSLPKGPRAPVLITGRPIEGGIVEVFSTRFLLLNAVLQWVSSATDEAVTEMEKSGLAHAEIASDGFSELHIVWEPFQPGRTMLEKAMPLMVVSILAFLLSALFLLNITRRATDALLTSEAQLRHAAAHDVLTGLKNRRTFEETLARLAARGPLTLACFDLDGFKPINDRYGHAAGDAVLQTIADRLRRACRPGLDEAFRLGGDEFALLLPGLVMMDARSTCRSISSDLAAPIALAEGTVQVGASVGFATVEGAASLRTALLRADAALYRAKSQRRAMIAAEDVCVEGESTDRPDVAA